MELDEHFPSNSSSPDCLSKKCYFSELNDLSKEADYYELYKIHSSNDFKSPNTKKAHSNATMQIQNDKDLIIISKGGMVFSLPLDQKIERIFPISDGLIIEFFIKQEPKLSDILSITKSPKFHNTDDFFQNESQKLYSYATLTRHPLNSLRILSLMRKSDEISMFPWFRSTERIGYVSPNFPILISYNIQHSRHAMYLMRANLEDQEKEVKKLNFADNFYLLSGFWENPSCLNNSNVLIEMFYEETNKESMVSKCRFLRNICSRNSEIIICSLISNTSSISYLKLYSFNYLRHDSEQILAMNSVKILGLINEIRDFKCFDLFQTKNMTSQTYDLEKHLLKKQNPAKYQHFKMFLKQRSLLKTSFITFNINCSFSLYNANLHKILTYNLNLPLQMNIFFNEPIIKLSRFTKNLTQFENSQKETVLLKILPEIKNPLISLILTTLSKILDQKLFDKILNDIIRLCIKFDHIIILEESQTPGYNGLIQSKSTEEDFENMIIYFVYMIRISTKTPCEDIESSSSSLYFLNMDEFPSKKMKFLNEKSTHKPLKELTNWDRLLISDFHSSYSANPSKIFTKNLTDFPITDPNNINLANSFEPIELHRHYSETLHENPMKNHNNMLDITTPLELFTQNRLRIFRVLHLLYENLKIQSSSEQNRKELGFFLFSYMKYLNHDCSLAYCDYYLRDDPNLFSRFHQFPGFKRLETLLNRTYISYNVPHLQNFIENDFEKDPPNLYNWQNELLKFHSSTNLLTNSIQHQFPRFPILFKLSGMVCKIFGRLLSKKKEEIWNSLSDFLFKGNENFSINNELYHNYKNLPLMNFEAFYPAKSVSRTAKKTQMKLIIKKIAESPSQLVFLYLVKKKITSEFISNMNISLQTIIMEILRNIRLEMPSILRERLPKLAYSLINRFDIYKNLKQQKTASKQKPKGKTQAYLLSDTVNSIIKGNPCPNIKDPLIYMDIKKPTDPSPQNDLIFNEVIRILDVQKPLKIKAKYVENIPEDRLEIDSQGILLKICIRRLSTFVGTGAFRFSSHQSFITEILKIPKICLSAILPTEQKITLELKDENPANQSNPLESKANLALWPEFHNGVSTALKLSSYAFAMNPNHMRTWIFYQKPESPRYDHGGFLLGLGLLGYLSSFLPTDIYQYLRISHDATTVGILLGLSASRIGKVDESLSKTLCLHIPYLLPPSYEVEISLLVQTAALIGIGLLNLSSCNRLVTELTLAQIGRKPPNDKCLDRDGYSLAAGYALGLINLAKGGLNPTIKDLELEERLIRFIEGGKPMEPPGSMLTTNFNFENKCSSIREGKSVNTHITAPAGLLALSLIYLKSNNNEVCKRITIPNSFTGIENTNPNHILLKTIARNLIMWDSIQNTCDFIYDQIPDLIRFIYEKRLKEIHERYSLKYNVEEIDYNTVTLIYVNIIAGCIMAMGLKYAGTGDYQTIETIYEQIAKFRKIKQTKCDLANDPANKSALDQYNQFSILCVSLLACSLILAGTCDIKLLKLIRIIRKKLQDSGLSHYGFNMALNMAIGFLFLGNGKYSFRRDNQAIAGLLIAIYPHFPNHTNDNKYHLQALRHFYILAIEQRVFYAVDIKSYEVVHVWVEMEFQLGKDVFIKEKLQTPVLLQDSKKLVGVEVIDEDFYKVVVKYNNMNKAIFVKRRLKKKNTREIENKREKSDNGNNYNYNNNQRELDLLLNLIKTLENNKETMDYYDVHTLDFILSGKTSQNLTKSQFIKKLSSEYKFLYKRSNLFEGQLSDSIVPLFIKEDRLEFFEMFFILNRKYQDIGQVPSEFIMNFHVIFHFYSILPSLCFNKNQFENSQILNGSKLKKIRENLNNLFNFNELIKSTCFTHYFERPELALLLVFNPQNPEKLEEITKFCLIYQIPNKRILFSVKRFLVNSWKKFKSNLNSDKQDAINESIGKSLLILAEIAGLLRMPLCDHSVFLKICEEIYLKKLI